MKKEPMSKVRAQSTLQECGLIAAYDLWESYATSGEIPAGDEATVFDIVSRLVSRNQFTERQESFLRTLLQRIENHKARQAEWEAESANAEPVPAPMEGERMVVSGEVLSIKVRETFNGSALKMLVRSDEGWRVWGTVPAAVRNELEEGNFVRFTATVKPSDKDPKFGFFSRPSKAMILNACVEE